MDHLSALVDLVDAQCSLSGAVIASGDWGIHLPSPRSLKLLVIKARFWIQEEAEAPFCAEPGDIVVVQSGRSFLMGSSPQLRVGGIARIARDALIAKEVYSSPECMALCCHVTLHTERGRSLLAALPNHILVSGGGSEATILRALYEQLVTELREPGAGSELAVDRLTQLILLQMLRAHSSNEAGKCAVPPQDWVNGLKDPGLSKALNAMRRSPEKRWTLDDLTRITSMSRTCFVEHFRTAMGEPPLTYLRSMRMAMAAKELRDSPKPIALIGRDLGYESESAFSTAFKKTMKVSPKHYRDQLPHN
ncbi:AraC family transcriptional regulator [Aminobacter sp. UC22_36]|uniref:AraC family transcriptional regulator n=1 Tax=Aminobacter sp. UC22_36 TaxID=3374549 RepID=UPI003758422A